MRTLGTAFSNVTAISFFLYLIWCCIISARNTIIKVLWSFRYRVFSRQHSREVKLWVTGRLELPGGASDTSVWIRTFKRSSCSIQGKKRQSSHTTHLWRRRGERRYSSHFFTTWGWVVSVTPRPRFTSGNGTPVPIRQEAGWTSEPVLTEVRGRILLSLLGIEPRLPGRPK
jgi:hypothetical protein